ncbi:MAG: hypothetical protein H8E72_02005 [Candidatus Marinimicrobia bacterium]|nr:hypothetical protein [Candidatus Neomarinimicrobiota bacterium]
MTNKDKFKDFLKYDCFTMDILHQKQYEYLDTYINENLELILKYDLCYEHTFIDKMRKDSMTDDDIDRYIKYRKCYEDPYTYLFNPKFRNFEENESFFTDKYFNDKIIPWTFNLSEIDPLSDWFIELLFSSTNKIHKMLIDQIIKEKDSYDPFIIKEIEGFDPINISNGLMMMNKDQIKEYYQYGKNYYNNNVSIKLEDSNDEVFFQNVLSGSSVEYIINEIFNLLKDIYTSRDNEYFIRDFNLDNPSYLIMSLLVELGQITPSS